MYKDRIKRKEDAIKRTEAQLEIYEQKLVDDKGNKDLKKKIERAKTTIEKEKLFKKSYDANSFWNEVIIITDKNNLGKSFIKNLLEELDNVDDIAARSRGINVKNWKESEQRSTKNNFYIWQAINSVSKRFPYSPKIKNLSLL